MFNVLDYSCISFPTGMTVDKSVDKPLGDAYKPMTDLDSQIQSECKLIQFWLTLSVTDRTANCE